MAGRIRTIKPELLEDERVAGLSSHAFRLFVGCILLADDHGNLRLRVGLLAGAIFWRLMEEGRVSLVDIEAALVEVTRPDHGGERHGLLTPYRVRGQVYAHVSGWEKHQKVDHPGAPRMPLPTDPEADNFLFEYEGMSISRETHPRASTISRESLATDLRSPITDPDQKNPASAGAEPDGSGRFPASEESPPSSAKLNPLDPQAPAPTARHADPKSEPVSAAHRSPAGRRPPLTASLALPGVAEPGGPGAVQEIYDAYLEGWRKHVGGSRPPVLNDKRRKLIRAQLRYFPADDLRLACGGVWLSEFHVQQHHYGIDLVLRDAEHIEKFRDIALRGEPVPQDRRNLTPNANTHDAEPPKQRIQKPPPFEPATTRTSQVATEPTSRPRLRTGPFWPTASGGNT